MRIRTSGSKGEKNMNFKRVAQPALIAGLMVLGSVVSAQAFTACEVTDVGGIDDNGFNQTAWKGVEDAIAE
ncbi:MAG: hypothetical protein KKH72_13830, partial [Alphaproteobacteria bacterium]|nr:hypothetical protein [Alphaproteobacteria bacterium]